MAKLETINESGQTVVMLGVLAIAGYAAIKISGFQLPGLSDIFGTGNDNITVSKKQVDAANAANKAMAADANAQKAFLLQQLAATQPGYSPEKYGGITVNQTWDSKKKLIVNPPINTSDMSDFGNHTTWGGESIPITIYKK